MHGHDEESATGFEVSPYVNGSAALRVASDGKIQLPKTAILGLLVIAVFAPENKGEVIPPDYQLSWFDHVFFVSAWWGWQDHFREIVNVDRSSLVALDFGNSWSDWAPVG